MTITYSIFLISKYKNYVLVYLNSYLFPKLKLNYLIREKVALGSIQEREREAHDHHRVNEI